MVIVAEADEPEEEIEFTVTVEFEELEKRFNIGRHREVLENIDLKVLLAEFSNVFSDKPGNSHS